MTSPFGRLSMQASWAVATVGMAGLLSLVIGGNVTHEFINQKAIFAALFPINLLLVLQTGGQLFTGNSATMAIGVFEGKAKVKDLLRNWAIAYVANILGCLLIDLRCSLHGHVHSRCCRDGHPHRTEEVRLHLRTDGGEGNHVQLAGVHGSLALHDGQGSLGQDGGSLVPDLHVHRYRL